LVICDFHFAQNHKSQFANQRLDFERQIAAEVIEEAMPRKGHVPKREPAADPIYGSQLVTKFINTMMWGGKKSTAQGIFYQSMENLQSKGGDEALKLFKKAVENAKPLLEVKTRRVGGANYQVPVEVNPDRRTSLAIRWIVGYARERGEKGMVDKLTNELLDAANGRGAAIKKKEDVHRMAEANKAFAHYRW
jgi:small subunit ribosomal protein S7